MDSGAQVLDSIQVPEDDQGLQTSRMVAELFARVDEGRASSSNNGNVDGSDAYAFEVDEGDDGDSHDRGPGEEMLSDVDMEDLLRESHTPLYEGSPMNRLGTILMLLNLCSIHGVSNNFVDKLFSLLKQDLLSRSNTLPNSHYEACKVKKYLVLHMIQSMHVRWDVYYFKTSWQMLRTVQSVS